MLTLFYRKSPMTYLEEIMQWEILSDLLTFTRKQAAGT